MTNNWGKEFEEKFIDDGNLKEVTKEFIKCNSARDNIKREVELKNAIS